MTKLMIVDDDPSARRLMRDSLGLSGDEYEIFEADRGRFALQLISVVRPDIVLLDISMPEIGGIPVCTEIKRNPATSGTQIVIRTATSLRPACRREPMISSRSRFSRPIWRAGCAW